MTRWFPVWMAVGIGLLGGCGGSEQDRLREARERRRAEEARLERQGDELQQTARQALDLVFVPGGTFKMGEDSFGGVPEHQENVADFYLGRTEVSNEEYERFVTATDAIPPFDWEMGEIPQGRERHPARVPRLDAERYAEWVGCRLPTKAEWEKAARGTDGRKYPWGNNFDPSWCNSKESGIGDTAPVGSYPDGASPYGCLDMAGNVREWTSDSSEDGRKGIMKGGSFGDEARYQHAAYEFPVRPSVEKNPALGFRLARDAGSSQGGEVE